jgi:diguanylate cyclase (GGDEF)-like protein
MRFYRATQFLFPRSFELRLLAICFVAVHVPLIASVAVSALTWRWEMESLLVLLIATLLGTAGGVAAIHALLSPLTKATAMLCAIQEGARIDDVPAGGEDLVGRLLLGVTQAANEAAERSERLTHAAERDPLTGVRNRRGFLAAAQRAMRSDHPAVIALIDLDHFKSINDRLGHAGGDTVLQAFAVRLAKEVRGSDLCARWGGEEFAVLFPRATVEQARVILERLRASIGRDPLPGASLTFSGGLAMVRNVALLEEAVEEADAALYAAKRSGRDRINIAG